MVSNHRHSKNLYLSSAEASELLVIPERTLRHQCNSGHILGVQKDAAGA